MIDTVRKALIILDIIFLAIAAFGLYISLNSIIENFVNYEYAPVYQAILNAAILILALYLLKRALDRSGKP